ncbi:MAG: hypothetical protein K5872_11660 [Rhizobiaceae bacterium]|nr:hypothetical protein [Rhizobiaceae bacterium]MCV0406875.1 hypothetical protein [Rhizobiaceae bacterium]
MRRAALIFASILLAVAGIWSMLSGSPERIPAGWSWEANFVGTVTWPDPQAGAFPDAGELGLYERALSIASAADRPTAVTLKDDYVIRDPITDEVTWRYTVHSRVDPATGMHVDPSHHGEYVVFPRDVERRSYVLRMNYLKGVPLSFIKETTIEGLRVYLFGYKGRGEYTESYAGTAEYPGVQVAADQEIRCADDQFSFLVWVEPMTGEALKLAERCDSGDYVFNVSTNAPVSAVLRWGGETAGIDVLRRAERVRKERLQLQLSEYGPLALGLAAVGLGGLGLMCRRRARP